MKLNHEKLKKLIKIAYNKKMPLNIIGTIGIGKSWAVKEIAQELAKEKQLEFSEDNHYDDLTKFHFIDIRLSQIDGVDLRGLPNFNIENKTTTWFSPNWLPKQGEGLIFFDEINLAPPLTQAAVYQLALDRKLGDYKLPNGYSIIAAGNRNTDRANIYDMPAPLANRFIHCELKEPTLDEWCDWASKNDVDSRIIAFMQFKPDYLYKYNEQAEELAFSTPRSWVYTSNLIKEVNDNESVKMISSAAVGDGISIEFAAFNALVNKINIKEVMANPETFTIPEKIDEKYALLSSITEQYKENPKNLGIILKICKRLEPDEYQIFLLKMIKQSNEKEWVKRINGEKDWSKLSQKYEKYLLETGEEK